MCSFHLE